LMFLLYDMIKVDKCLCCLDMTQLTVPLALSY
jgi:hypothetical protein